MSSILDFYTVKPSKEEIKRRRKEDVAAGQRLKKNLSKKIDYKKFYTIKPPKKQSTGD